MKLIINNIKPIALILTFINIGLCASLLFFHQSLLSSFIFCFITELIIIVIYIQIAINKLLNDDILTNRNLLNENHNRFESQIQNYHQDIEDLKLEFLATLKECNNEAKKHSFEIITNYNNKFSEIFVKIKELYPPLFETMNLLSLEIKTLIHNSSKDIVYSHKEGVNSLHNFIDTSIHEIFDKISLQEKHYQSILNSTNRLEVELLNKKSTLTAKLLSYEKQNTYLINAFEKQKSKIEETINTVNKQLDNNQSSNQKAILNLLSCIDSYESQLKQMENINNETYKDITNKLYTNSNILVKISAQVKSILNTSENLDTSKDDQISLLENLRNSLNILREEISSKNKSIISNIINLEKIQYEIQDKINSNTISKTEEIDRNISSKLIKELNITYNRIDSLLSIHNVLNFKAPLPVMSEWSISSDFAHEVLSEILEKKHGSVLDIGSGISTIIFGYGVKKNGTGKVIAIEHTEEYFQKTKQLIIAHNLSKYCEVYHCPLVKYTIKKETWLWYDISKVNFPNDINILSVDGPPGGTQYMARYPALPLLRKHLKNDFTIFMDDAYRKDEIEVAKQWEQEFNLALKPIKSHRGLIKFNLK